MILSELLRARILLFATMEIIFLLLVYFLARKIWNNPEAKGALHVEKLNTGMVAGTAVTGVIIPFAISLGTKLVDRGMPSSLSFAFVVCAIGSAFSALLLGWLLIFRTTIDFEGKDSISLKGSDTNTRWLPPLISIQFLSVFLCIASFIFGFLTYPIPPKTDDSPPFAIMQPYYPNRSNPLLGMKRDDVLKIWGRPKVEAPSRLVFEVGSGMVEFVFKKGRVERIVEISGGVNAVTSTR